MAECTINKLSKLTGFAEQTIKLYLCRAEFSHIEVERGGMCKNVTQKDVDRLRELRRWRRQ